MNAYATEDTPLTTLLTCDAVYGDGYWKCCLVAHPEQPNNHWMIHQEAS